MMITLLIAFAVGIVLGKAMLPVLHKLKFGQNIYELAPEAHKKKQGTPTMGGLVIAGAAIAAALVMNDYSVPMGQNMLLAMLLMALGNLCIGFVDDMTKIRKGKNGGLTPKQKMIFQTLLALAFSCYCYFHPQVGSVIKVPFFRVEWDLGIWYIPMMMFIIVGTTNSANLLDGLDGLLTSVSMVDFATLAVLCGAASLGSLGVGCAAMCGACMAFLSRNAYPAQMFMGDTGSMFIGGAVVAANAFVFGNGDPVSAPKLIKEFITAAEKDKKTSPLTIKAGIMDGAVQSVEEVKALADILPREQLIAKIMGCLNSQATALAYVIQAIADKKAEAGEQYAPQDSRTDGITIHPTLIIMEVNYHGNQ